MVPPSLLGATILPGRHTRHGGSRSEYSRRLITASFQDGRRTASFFSDEAPSSRRTSSTASSPWLHRRFTPGPCNQDPNGPACWSLVAQAPPFARSDGDFAA